MRKRICMLKPLWLILLLLPVLLSGCMSPAAFNPLSFLGTSWKEEVLLHDGRTIIVERSQSYGGRHEIGQSPPIQEQHLKFTLPETQKTINWTSEYSKDVGRANFELLALHILQDIPYIVASPNLCLSYNKWGRPNPPYVLFKHIGKEWQRIPLEELPSEFKTLNVTINTKSHEKHLVGQEVVSAEMVRKLNSSLRQPEYKTILREPLEPKDNFGSIVTCEVMIRNERNDGWKGFDISSIHSYSECLDKCKKKKISEQFCPCNNLLKTKPEWR